MIPLGIGEKFAGRYFVITASRGDDPGEFVEARDAQGGRVWLQVLSTASLSPPLAETLRREITTPVPGEAWLTPTEVVLSATGVPAALYAQSPPTRTLAAALEDIAIDPFKPKARAKVIEWFATLAESLFAAHAKGLVHGAIDLPVLRLRDEDSGAPKLVLSAIGRDAATRILAGGERRKVRADLAALVLTLVRCLERARLPLESPSAARWNILVQCARAGDHPALASARVLSVTLRELASAEAAVAPRKAPPPRTESKANAVVGAPAPSPQEPAPDAGAAGSRERTTSSAGKDFVSLAPPPEAPRAFWTPLRLRVALVVGGTALVAGAAFVFKDLGTETTLTGAGTLRSARATHRESCGDEPADTPLTADCPAAMTEFGARCSPDRLNLVFVGRAEHHLVAAARQSRRGGSFLWNNARLADDAAEVSLPLGGRQGVYVAWRRTGGVPFGLVRVEEGAVPRPLAGMSGWPVGSFRGVFLLSVDDLGAYLATTLEGPGGPQSVVVRAAFEGSGERSVAYALGRAEVLSVIPGEQSTLLLRDGATLHTLRLPVTTLGLLATGTTDVRDAGVLVAPDSGVAQAFAPRAINLRSLPTSARLELNVSVLRAAREGALLDGAKAAFVGTEGSAPGRVVVWEFPTSGDAQTVALHARGEADAIVHNGPRPQVVFRADSRVRAVDFNPDGTSGPDANVAVAPYDAAGLVACGDQSWLAFQRRGHQGAVPLGCVVERH